MLPSVRELRIKWRSQRWKYHFTWANLHHDAHQSIVDEMERHRKAGVQESDYSEVFRLNKTAAEEYAKAERHLAKARELTSRLTELYV